MGKTSRNGVISHSRSILKFLHVYFNLRDSVTLVSILRLYARVYARGQQLLQLLRIANKQKCWGTLAQQRQIDKSRGDCLLSARHPRGASIMRRLFDSRRDTCPSLACRTRPEAIVSRAHARARFLSSARIARDTLAGNLFAPFSLRDRNGGVGRGCFFEREARVALSRRDKRRRSTG